MGFAIFNGFYLLLIADFFVVREETARFRIHGLSGYPAGLIDHGKPLFEFMALVIYQGKGM